MAPRENLPTPDRQMSPDEKGVLLLRYLSAKRPVVSWNEAEQRWDLLDFSGARLSGADLRGADLRWVDFSGAHLDGVDLRGADLTRANLSRADLRRAHLEGARLGGADLRSARLEGAGLTRVDAEGLNLQGSDLRGVNLSEARLGGAHLDGADLSGAQLPEADLDRASLEGANLSGACLDRAVLEGCSLNGATLNDASLVDAKLRGARMRGAKLSGAQLLGADLRAANLLGADLNTADLTGVLLDGAFYDDHTAWPDVFSEPTEAYRIGPDSVLRAADLEGADLHGADLSRANLEGANAAGANFTGARLAGAELVYASFARANLEKADLEGANIAGSDLQWANLRLSNLHWANMSRVNLERANLEGANLHGADLVGAALEKANMEGANLEDAYLNESDLQGADLQLANLKGAHLRGTNFWEADLRGACLKNISGFPQDLEDCKVSSLTYSQSGWTLSSFLRWYQAGVDISDLENFPDKIQEWFRDNREGLVFYLRTTQDRLARFVLDGVILGLLGGETECEVQTFDRVDGRTVIRINARRQVELGALAELLHRRVWEHPETNPENARMRQQLGEVLQGRLLDRLSILMDQCERMEQWGFQEGELVKVKSWVQRVEGRGALSNLLKTLFDGDELRELLELRRDADADALVPGEVDPNDLAVAAATALESRGMLDQPFFLQLREERPGRWRDIHYVAELWNVDASEDVLLGEAPE